MDDWLDLEPDPADDHEEETAPVEPEPESAHSANATATQLAIDNDDPVCRICFSGPEEKDLGASCVVSLKGTVAKVHVECLNRWRNASRGRTSWFQCDQCKYKYRIKRAKIAGLAENTYALAGLTVFFFSILVFMNGFIGNWLLRQGQSDSLANAIFFKGAEDTSWSYSYREPYLPLDAIGYAAEFASKIADSLDKVGGPQKVIMADERTESESAYRKVRRVKKSATRKAVSSVKKGFGHAVLGLGMTSIGSFLWMLGSLPLMGLRHGLFRSLRPGRDNRGNLTPMGTVIIVIFLLVGFIKSIHVCWKLTRKTARLILTRAEDGILEVRG